eukprot:6488107-Amphidinium_carterae.1
MAAQRHREVAVQMSGSLIVFLLFSALELCTVVLCSRAVYSRGTCVTLDEPFQSAYKGVRFSQQLPSNTDKFKSLYGSYGLGNHYLALHHVWEEAIENREVPIHLHDASGIAQQNMSCKDLSNDSG